MFLTPTSDNEAITVIQSLKTKNSSGFDEMYNRLIELCAEELIRLITSLVNSSLTIFDVI